MENLIKLIREKINQAERGDSAKLYFLTSESCISMGDESTLHTIIYETNQKEELYEEITEREDAMIQEIRNMPEMKEERTFAYSYTTSHGDYCRVQFSDHCIYIIGLHSGQY